MPELFASPKSLYDILKDEYGPLVTIPQSAKIVGNHVSGWYKWIAEGTVPVPTIMIGGSRRIRLIDLCEYLDAQAAASTTAPAKSGQSKKKDGTPKGTPGRKPKFNPAVLSHA